MRPNWVAPFCAVAWLPVTMLWRLLAIGGIFLIVPSALCLAGEVEVVEATVPPADGPGGDVPLLMRLVNHAAEPDALLRVRCPFANFSEKHTVDYGEGAPAMRSISVIKLPAGADIVLTTKGVHVMLLQVRQKLTEGEVLTCTLAFRNAGAEDIQVRVSRAAAHS